MIIFRAQPTLTSRIGSLARSIHTLIHVVTVHTHTIHIYVCLFFEPLINSIANGPPSILPMVTITITKELPISPLPASRLTNFYRDASSALLQIVNQRLNFTYSHVLTKERTQILVTRINLATSTLVGVEVTY